MRKLLLLLVLFFMSSTVCFSAPNYDPNQKPVIYDSSYNIDLRNKLEDEYHKKYVTCNREKTVCTNNAPIGAYGKEVILPYDLNKKRWEDTIISK